LQAICLLVKEKLSKEALEKTAKEKGTKVSECTNCQGLPYSFDAHEMNVFLNFQNHLETFSG